MVQITELNTTILDTIKNGGEVNPCIIKLYDKGLKYNYELCKKGLEIKKCEIHNRYKIADSVIRRINFINNRRDNFIRFLSILLILTGGIVSLVCYKNTAYVNSGLNKIYISLNENILSNSSYYYERLTLDEGIYILGYVYTVINSIIKIVLVSVESVKYIILSILGILVSLSEIGSVIISSVLFFVTIVFTMCMMKLMNSSISIGLTGTYIRDEGVPVHIGEIDSIVNTYLQCKTTTD